MAGQPVVGRSGGGLFSADGMVIGVCNAAEPTNREGFYAALEKIDTVLDQQHLASLYQQPIAPLALVPAMNRASDPRAMLAANDPFARAARRRRCEFPTIKCRPHRTRPPPSLRSPARAPCAAANQPTALSDSEQMALQEIHRKLREGSEVVCIIRDRNDPKSNSQVITLDRASPIFVNELARDAAGPVVTHPTALKPPSRGHRSLNGTPKPAGSIRTRCYVMRPGATTLRQHRATAIIIVEVQVSAEILHDRFSWPAE